MQRHQETIGEQNYELVMMWFPHEFKYFNNTYNVEAAPPRRLVCVCGFTAHMHIILYILFHLFPYPYVYHLNICISI